MNVEGSTAPAGSSPLTRGKRSARIRRTTGKRAHPRSRGENVGRSAVATSWRGSSPLTRGKLLAPRADLLRERLIPAHAGKTDSGKRSWIISRAHPRSRGENHGEHFGGGLIEGSSPLTRGKHGAKTSLPPGPGLIPAHAGKTRSSVKLPYCLRAHPRSRGENSAAFGWINGSLGSSPLTRGKLLVGAGDNLTGGAHPRSRGENEDFYSESERRRGSSPLTRGKLQRVLNLLDNAGLIPAHAGKTSPHATAGCPRRAHPRSRGENVKANATTGEVVGSSPLTRGKRSKVGFRVAFVGLIPAHAGKTYKFSLHPCYTRAHPRSRGENAGQTMPLPLSTGSSPLTRGKRRPPRRRGRS